MRVEFTVQVPLGVRFSANTLSGDIDAAMLTADVDAFTNRGGITITTTGGAQATTQQGSIKASIGSVTWNGFHFFDTLNGDIDLQIPADANTAVKANTLRGVVTSDFLLTTRTTPWGSSMAYGTLGTDGRTLSLSTNNGNITLRQGAATGQ